MARWGVSNTLTWPNTLTRPKLCATPGAARQHNAQPQLCPVALSHRAMKPCCQHEAVNRSWLQTLETALLAAVAARLWWDCWPAAAGRGPLAACCRRSTVSVIDL